MGFIAVALVHRCGAIANAETPDELQLIRAAVRQTVLRDGTAELTAVSQTVDDDLKSMRPDGSWADQVYTDTDRLHWKASAHLPRLERIAREYYRKDRVPPAVRDRLVTSLNYWFDRDPHNVNWWHNEIGVPRNVGDILMILGNDAPPQLKNRGVELMKRANWKRQTGANLLDETWIQVMRGCIGNSLPVISEAFARTWDELRIVNPKQEGIQADGSFHQHGPLLYSQSYGGVLLGDARKFISVSTGTAYAPPPSAMDTLNTMLLDGDAWMSRNTVWDWGTCGRAICRRGATALSMQATLEDFSHFPSARQSEAAQLAKSNHSELPIGNRFFWNSDYMVQRSRDYFASVRMYSARTANTDELTNGENQQSHHIADGATCLMLTGREYFDIYPVWDWSRIPGTTIEQGVTLPAKAIKRMGKTDFVGGVSNQKFGFAAMDLVYDALHAHKSWFCFDDQIVCLGAGINCDEDHTVLTTLNQCLLNGPVQASGQSEALLKGEHHLKNARWIWHDSIGYVLPESADVELKIEPQTGSWSNIGVGSTDRISHDVFNAVISHGNRPHDAAYQYILLPNATAEKTADVADKPTAQVLSNTAQLQAVWNSNAQILGAAFFQPGEIRAADFTLRVDQPCMVMVQKQIDQIGLWVSSPTHSIASVNVSLSLPLQGQSNPIRVDLPTGNAAGQTWSATFKTAL